MAAVIDDDTCTTAEPMRQSLLDAHAVLGRDDRHEIADKAGHRIGVEAVIAGGVTVAWISLTMTWANCTDHEVHSNVASTHVYFRVNRDGLGVEDGAERPHWSR